jgi:predicted unusual protein kinase regulating ubiquinone biosynthesis (AarF/ABC1/UbiB family)
MSLGSLKRGLQYTELGVLLSAQKVLPKALGQKALKRAYREKLAQLRGIPLKVSQMLSMGDHDEADAYREVIEKLEPYPISAWSELIRNNMAFQEQVKAISEEGISASLGQVHKVLLKDGSEMALKLKYPEIDQDMNLDSALLGLVQTNFEAFKTQEFKLPDYQKVLNRELKEEMDYSKEASKQIELHKIFEDHIQIVIPEVHSSLSNQTMIVMDWESSIPYDQFKTQVNREDLIVAMRLLCEFYFKLVFEEGWLYADPNPGNFGFRKEGDHVQLVVYDYGSVVPFEKAQALTLLKMLKIIDQGEGDIYPWFGELGFQMEILKPLRSQLMAFTDLIFEPFLSSGRYHLKTWSRKERAKDILGDQRWNFMLAAPPELIFFMRSLQTLFFYGDKFAVGIFLRPYIEQQWSQNKAALQELRVEVSDEDFLDFSMAKNLHLHVTQNGKTKVQLALPRSSVECLDEIMDEELVNKIQEEGIELDKIVQKTRRFGYRAGELFSVQKGDKKIRIYLE